MPTILTKNVKLNDFAVLLEEKIVRMEWDLFLDGPDVS